MNTLPRTPEQRQQYYDGFEMRLREVRTGELFDVGRMEPNVRRGYEAACRAQADAETSSYLVGQGRDGEL